MKEPWSCHVPVCAPRQQSSDRHCAVLLHGHQPSVQPSIREMMLLMHALSLCGVTCHSLTLGYLIEVACTVCIASQQGQSLGKYSSISWELLLMDTFQESCNSIITSANSAKWSGDSVPPSWVWGAPTTGAGQGCLQKTVAKVLWGTRLSSVRTSTQVVVREVRTNILQGRSSAISKLRKLRWLWCSQWPQTWHKHLKHEHLRCCLDS